MKNNELCGPAVTANVSRHLSVYGSFHFFTCISFWVNLSKPIYFHEKVQISLQNWAGSSRESRNCNCKLLLVFESSRAFICGCPTYGFPNAAGLNLQTVPKWCVSLSCRVSAGRGAAAVSQEEIE